MKYRIATKKDISVLAAMNRQLTEDENHRNRFKSDQWFKERIERFLRGEYQAVLFEKNHMIIAYALYRNHPDHDDTILLRQIFVDRDHRRQGVGREVMGVLNQEIWPRDKRLTVEVLSHNSIARKFYESVGYKEYCLELEIKPEDRNR